MTAVATIQTHPVFVLTLPLELAPTLNRYGQMKGWQKENLAKAIDWRIVAAKGQFPHWACGIVRGPQSKTGRPGKATGGRKRAVCVTRYSSSEPDTFETEAIGGKVPIDRLVHANVLRDDKREWCTRSGAWLAAPKLAGKLVVAVYEIDGSEVG